MVVITFNKRQSIPLMIEYTRYVVYRDILKNMKHKAFFVQQSLERFVLDCINQGNGDYRELFFNPGLSNPDLSNFFRDLEYNRLVLTKEQREWYIQLIKSHNTMFLKLVQSLESQEVTAKFDELVTGIRFSFMGYKTVLSKFRYGLLLSRMEEKEEKEGTDGKEEQEEKEGKEDQERYYKIARVILRYSIFEESGQQWSIGSTDLYYRSAKELGITAEMFASPFNFLLNNFCSLMIDTDAAFGSMGSFFKITAKKLAQQGITGVTYNPPYPEEIMKVASPRVLKIIDDMNKMGNTFNVISFLPNWKDATYIQEMLQSKWKVAHREYKKGEFMLQDKWSGKMFKGTFNLLVIILSSNPDALPVSKAERILESVRKEARA